MSEKNLIDKRGAPHMKYVIVGICIVVAVAIVALLIYREEETSSRKKAE